MTSGLILAGVSGGGLPTAPSPASGAGFNRLLFFDKMNSLSTYDTGHTLVNGFNFYLDPAWPNVGAAGDSQSQIDKASWASFPPVNAATYSVINRADATDGLCIQNTSGGTASKIAAITAAYKNNSNGYVGTVFNPGFYAEARLSWNADTAFGPPAFWSLPLEFLNGTTDLFNEMDVMESDDTSTGIVHHADIFWNPYSQTPGNYQFLTHNSTAFVKDQFFTYGWLWKTIAQNGGTTGFHKFYVDDVLQETISYGAGSNMATMETMRWPLFFSNPLFNVMLFDKMNVWGP